MLYECVRYVLVMGKLTELKESYKLLIRNALCLAIKSKKEVVHIVEDSTLK